MKQFNNFMKTGKISNAIVCLSGELSSGILSPNDTINGNVIYERLLEKKHPTPSQVYLNYLID